MVGDFFSSLLFYLLPLLTGRLIVRNLFYAWVLGSLIWFVIFALLGILRVFLPFVPFSQTIQFIGFVVLCVNLAHILYSAKNVRFAVSLSLLPYGLLFIIAIGLYFFVWKENTPYPLQLNWDVYEHVTLANRIADGKFSLLPSHISDTFTFNGYTPLFHTLLALIKTFSGRNLLGVFWWLEYWHYVLTILLTYRFGRNVVSPLIAFLGALLSGLVFESSVVYASFFLIPQTLAAFIALGMMTYPRTRPVLLFCSFLVLAMTHYAVGLIGSFVVITFLLVSRLSVSKKQTRFIIAASTVLLAVSMALHAFGTWTLTNREEAAHFVFTLTEKTTFLLNWYGIAFPVFLFAGAYVLFRYGTKEQKTLLALMMITTALSFAPFSYVLKFFVIGRYFMVMVMAVGAGYFLSFLSPRKKIVAAWFLVLSFFIVFAKNQSTYKQPLFYKKELASHISRDEVKAGEFLASHREGFLISDPSTQYVLEAASGVNSQGGAYMDLDTRHVLSSFNLFGDPSLELPKLGRIHDKLIERKDPTFLVLSGRFFAWQRMSREDQESFSKNIWTPQALFPQDRLTIESFAQKTRLVVLYQSDEMVILKL